MHIPADSLEMFPGHSGGQAHRQTPHTEGTELRNQRMRQSEFMRLRGKEKRTIQREKPIHLRWQTIVHE